jgi:hypothetical protein
MLCDHLRGRLREYPVVPVKFSKLLSCCAVAYLALCCDFGGASPHEDVATEIQYSFSLLTNLYGTIFCGPTLPRGAGIAQSV